MKPLLPPDSYQLANDFMVVVRSWISWRGTE